MRESTQPDHPPESGGFLSVIQEEWRFNERRWQRPGLHAVLVYRLQSRVEQHPRHWVTPILRTIGRALARLVHVRYGIELHPSARIGRRLEIGHQGGIVIGPGVVMGDDCVLRQGVKIGCDLFPTPGDGGAPRIGNQVSFGARAVVAGPVQVGDGCKIGPNSVVLHDVAPHLTVIAPPSGLIRQV